MADHGHDSEPEGRVTSPMQGFSSREVGIGFAVFLVGLLVTYVVPALI